MSDNELQIDFSLSRPPQLLRMSTHRRWNGILGVSGPSGAGKTSLLRVLAGLEPQARGRVLFNGEVLQDSAQAVFIAPHRRRVVAVFQDARLFTHLDVLGNLAYAARRATATPALDRDTVIALLGLAPLLQRKVDGLSGGETQRVAIARAVLAAPRLLLLDEPVSALDARGRDDVLSCIERVRDASGLPMLYVSHADAELRRLATQILALETEAYGASCDETPPGTMVDPC